MSSSISSATQQQQFVQVPQATAKADATKVDPTKTDPAKAGAQPAALTAQQPTATTVAKGVVETASTRNPDGTFGPKHTIKPPANLLKASATSGSSSEVGVNVKI